MQAKWNSGRPEFHFAFSGRSEFSGRPEIFMWAETFFVSGRNEIFITRENGILGWIMAIWDHFSVRPGFFQYRFFFLRMNLLRNCLYLYRARFFSSIASRNSWLRLCWCIITWVSSTKWSCKAELKTHMINFSTWITNKRESIGAMFVFRNCLWNAHVQSKWAELKPVWKFSCEGEAN